MAKMLPVRIDGATVYVEAATTYGIEETRSREQLMESAADAFERATTTVTSVASKMIGAIRAMGDQLGPDEFEMEFGIKFSAEGNVFVASASGEAALKVRLGYKRSTEG